MREPDIEINHTSDKRVQKVYRFPNGYGASVVKGTETFGVEDDLWEIAVLKFTGPRLCDFELEYGTPVTLDAPKDEQGVCGHLTEATVEGLLQLIEGLDAN
jgi:hypothetical protein